MDALDERMIVVLGRTEKAGVRFHHATQNSEQFKTAELFTSGIFNLIFSDHSRLTTGN